MVEGRGKFEWNQTSALMALAANIVRDPRKGKTYSASDFNPFAKQEKPIKLRGKDMLQVLKAAFIKEG